MDRLERLVTEACEGLDGVEPNLGRNLFDGIEESAVAEALALSTRSLIERDPDYGSVAARLLLDRLRREALEFLDLGLCTLDTALCPGKILPRRGFLLRKSASVLRIFLAIMGPLSPFWPLLSG